MSTCEYIVSCHATKEVLWLCKLIELLGHPQDTTWIWNDNSRSITLTKDLSFHAHTKHIDIQYHFIHERVQSPEVEFKYLHTANMPTDILTKPLPGPKHAKLVVALGLQG